MSELSRALGNKAPKHSIECHGKTYNVGLVTQSVKVAYEKRMFSVAKDALAMSRELFTSEEYSLMVKQLMQQYEEGDFALEGERGMKALKSDGNKIARGGIVLCSLLFDCDETEMLGILASKPEEAIQALDLSIKQSFPDVKIEAKKSKAR